MFVKHLTVGHFRNHEHSEVALEPGINLFVGPNGQGKTNLVEAIYYLATLSSHRVAGYLPMIRKGDPMAVIRALASHQGRDVLLEAELNRDSKNRVRINKNESSRSRDIIGYVQAVMFAPEDLDIVKKDPSHRRAFIDQLVVQFNPRFAGIYSDYDRVLRQRNTLLKSARTNSVKGAALSTLDSWDEQLVKLGSEIVVARNRLVASLNPEVLAAYQSIAETRNEPLIQVKSSLLETVIPTFGDDDAEDENLQVLSSVDLAEVSEFFRNRLAQVRAKELERGLTLVGPQRDDLVLLLNELPAKGYASHGESWSYALALRLASREILRRESQSGDPVLILDDVFAELDAGRRKRLAQMVSDNEQVLITAAVEADVPRELSAKMFHVKLGKVSDSDDGAE